MCAYRLLVTVGGESPPHTASTSRPVVTTSPGCSANTASTDFRRSPGIGAATPSTVTSTGPSSRTCTAWLVTAWLVTAWLVTGCLVTGRPPPEQQDDAPTSTPLQEHGTAALAVHIGGSGRPSQAQRPRNRSRS